MALIIWVSWKKFQNIVIIKNYFVMGVYIELIYSYGNEDFNIIACMKCEQKATTWPCKV